MSIPVTKFRRYCDLTLHEKITVKGKFEQLHKLYPWLNFCAIRMAIRHTYFEHL